MYRDGIGVKDGISAERDCGGGGIEINSAAVFRIIIGEVCIVGDGDITF